MKLSDKWNLVTMIPFFFFLFFINNTLLFYSLLFLTLIGMVHHYYVDSYLFLILDCMSVVIVFTVLTFLLHLTDDVKKMLLVLEFSVFFLFLFSFIFSLRLSNRVLLFLVSLVWFPVVFLSLDFLSVFSVCLIFFSIFLYLWSLFVSHRVTWGVFHILSAVSAFFVLRDLHLLTFSQK